MAEILIAGGLIGWWMFGPFVRETGRANEAIRRLLNK